MNRIKNFWAIVIVMTLITFIAGYRMKSSIPSGEVTAVPEDMSGIAGNYTPAQFEAVYGDSYDMQVNYIYDDEVDRGKIIRLASTFSEGDKPCVRADVSMGYDYGGADEKCDFKNLIDPEVYFADEFVSEDTVSYNVFYAPGGHERRVKFYELTDGTGTHNMMTYNYNYFYNNANAAEVPCSYNGEDYSFYGNFALSLEDYNGDGCPDFLYKAAKPEHNGCYYRIHLTDDGSVQSDAGINDDPVLFIYGRTADSIRLDRINRDAFLYFTRDSSDRIVPQVLNFKYGSDNISRYENNGWVFTSFYEDGEIQLKATAVSDDAVHDDDFTVLTEICLKRLDGMVWRDVPLETDRAEFTFSGVRGSDTVRIEKKLSKGVYRLEVGLEGKYSYTEFYVRSDPEGDEVEPALEEDKTEELSKEEEDKRRHYAFMFALPQLPGEEDSETAAEDSEPGEEDSETAAEDSEPAAKDNGFAVGDSEPVTVLDLYNMPHSSLPDITRLDIVIDFQNDGFDIFNELTGLEELNIRAENCYPMADFGFLEGMSSLKVLNVTADEKNAVFDLDDISEDCDLQELSLEGFDAILNIRALSSHKGLKRLSLGSTDGTVIARLEDIGSFDGLVSLSLKNIRTVSGVGYGDGDMDFLGGLTGLRELRIKSFPHLWQLPDISGLTELQSLEITECGNLTDYDFLEDMDGLKKFTCTENAVSGEALEHFKEAAPDCKIICVPI